MDKIDWVIATTYGLTFVLLALMLHLSLLHLIPFFVGEAIGGIVLGYTVSWIRGK